MRALDALAWSFVLSSCAVPEAPDPSEPSTDARDAGADRLEPLDAGASVDAGARDEEAPDEPDAGPPPVQAPSALARGRDALLDSLAARDELTDRCAQWEALDADQRAVFLLITDLLGQRTLLEDGSSALDHTEALLAVRGRQQSGCVRCCGDSDFNRLYLVFDALLIARVRDTALPGWRSSLDPAGPHEPFTRSLETAQGGPRGQLHVFASDEHAAPIARPGVEDALHPRAAEIDLDFNLIHESAPLCIYRGTPGVEHYVRSYQALGLALDPALDYTPSGCG